MNGTLIMMQMRIRCVHHIAQNGQDAGQGQRNNQLHHSRSLKCDQMDEGGGKKKIFPAPL